MQDIKLEDRFISDYMDVKFEIKDLYLIFSQPENNCHLELRSTLISSFLLHIKTQENMNNNHCIVNSVQSVQDI